MFHFFSFFIKPLKKIDWKKNLQKGFQLQVLKFESLKKNDKSFHSQLLLIQEMNRNQIIIIDKKEILYLINTTSLITTDNYEKALITYEYAIYLYEREGNKSESIRKLEEARKFLIGNKERENTLILRRRILKMILRLRNSKVVNQNSNDFNNNKDFFNYYISDLESVDIELYKLTKNKTILINTNYLISVVNFMNGKFKEALREFYNIERSHKYIRSNEEVYLDLQLMFYMICEANRIHLKNNIWIEYFIKYIKITRKIGSSYSNYKILSSLKQYNIIIDILLEMKDFKAAGFLLKEKYDIIRTLFILNKNNDELFISLATVIWQLGKNDWYDNNNTSSLYYFMQFNELYENIKINDTNKVKLFEKYVESCLVIATIKTDESKVEYFNKVLSMENLLDNTNINMSKYLHYKCETYLQIANFYIMKKEKELSLKFLSKAKEMVMSGQLTGTLFLIKHIQSIQIIEGSWQKG